MSLVIKKRNFYEEIDTTALEVGDSFVMLKHRLPYKQPIIHLTVSNVLEKDMVAVSPEGKEYRFDKESPKSFCYPNNSKFVKELILRGFFRDIAMIGPDSVDKELLDALEAWTCRQIAKKAQKQEKTDRD